MRSGFLLGLAFFITAASGAFAAEYETFDGRVYNGKKYPRIDIIEWNEEKLPSHMEFQNYTLDIPVDMTFQLEEKNGRKVMLVRYYLKDRGEYLCRRVLAPGHFRDGFLIYKDTSDPERVITMVSMYPLPEKKGRVLMNPEKYAGCELPSADRMPASDSNPQSGPNYDSQKRVVPKTGGGIGKEEGKVPFSDW